MLTAQADGQDSFKPNYYVQSRSYGTTRIDGTKPEYVWRLSETGHGIFRNTDWLVAGADFRVRTEYRHNDFRRPNATAVTGPQGQSPQTDIPTLLRTRLFLKLEKILDPLRLTVELEDARRYPFWDLATAPSKDPRQPPYPRDDRDFNTAEPIQIFAELYFPHLFGEKRPVHLRLGRMAFEFLDRRLIALNEWRNTTNTFEGLRATLGQEANDWYAEFLAVRPLYRFVDKIDMPGRQWLLGTILSLQRWSKVVTLQPFYLALLENKNSNNNGPEFPRGEFGYYHTTGLRVYAVFGETGWDYDFSYIKQWGGEPLQTGTPVVAQDAFAATAECGYTFAFLKTRLAIFYGYASGDRDRRDSVQNRFNRLYGFARPWSAHDYFQMENLSNPKLILAFEPAKKLQIDTAYTWFFAASPKDR
ncbi:MAG: alginate export family protein, partial [Leptospiraceae bacterium]|nr:alginate export family protein [Leptospiraceae bacterium]